MSCCCLTGDIHFCTFLSLIHAYFKATFKLPCVWFSHVLPVQCLLHWFPWRCCNLLVCTATLLPQESPLEKSQTPYLRCLPLVISVSPLQRPQSIHWYIWFSARVLCGSQWDKNAEPSLKHSREEGLSVSQDCAPEYKCFQAASSARWVVFPMGHLFWSSSLWQEMSSSSLQHRNS